MSENLFPCMIITKCYSFTSLPKTFKPAIFVAYNFYRALKSIACFIVQVVTILYLAFI